MKINRLHAIIGFLLVIIPFTGFTRGFKYGFSALAGATILYFAMRSIHEEIMKKHHRHRKNDSFVENKPKDSLKSETKFEKTHSATPAESDSSPQNLSHIADNN
ncbi:MAG: hypothetical protein JWP09_893 [Candidatus Taylorbacteria bacterium]|nr:hypothetical protein [Candidatus Taylorbacteria bacterium]